MTKKRPVVGVIGSAHLVEGKFTAQRVGERPLLAVAEAAGALPLIFAGTPEITDIGALRPICILTPRPPAARGGLSIYAIRWRPLQVAIPKNRS
jgi:hypothetical protein